MMFGLGGGARLPIVLVLVVVLVIENSRRIDYDDEDEDEDEDDEESLCGLFNWPLRVPSTEDGIAFSVEGCDKLPM